MSLCYVLAFYTLTPILFCSVVKDQGVCPTSDDPDQNYPGWISALYFASTTLSTVGYGDLTVEKTKVFHLLAGCGYMILANIMLIGYFSVVVDTAWNPLSKWHKRLMDRVLGEPTLDEPLYKKLRRVKLLRLTELVGAFVMLNLIGVFANRLFLLLGEDGDLLETDWNWVTSFYWAIQTTTVSTSFIL